MMTSPVEPEMPPPQHAHDGAGCEWIVDASGCSHDRLRSLQSLRTVCERLVRELELQVVGQPLWRQFPEPGGVTGLYLLSESHLACHTWPELGLATFNLFSCRRRGDWPWAARLCEMLGAESVSVRVAERGVVGADVVGCEGGATA
jgi:S-adenosylmethionine decarboxylase